MPATYTTIATTTISSPVNSVSFTGIPQTYTDLVMIVFYRDTRAEVYSYPALRFNNDSGSNYSGKGMFGAPGVLYDNTSNNDTVANIGEYPGANNASGEYGPGIINIMAYTAPINKTILVRSGNVNSRSGGGYNGAFARQWKNTAAITRVDLFADVGNSTNIATGSIITLFGIKAA